MAKKKTAPHPKVVAQMETDWDIELSEAPFHEGKPGNLPTYGYPCAHCASTQTKLQFAESSPEEESILLWMELKCKNCRLYTLYTRKEL